jgi:hypothetical protein
LSGFSLLSSRLDMVSSLNIRGGVEAISTLVLGRKSRMNDATEL